MSFQEAKNIKFTETERKFALKKLNAFIITGIKHVMWCIWLKTAKRLIPSYMQVNYIPLSPFHKDI